MILIPDDPIVRSMERTGYPPWYFPRWNWGDEDYEREDDWEEDEEYEE